MTTRVVAAFFLVIAVSCKNNPYPTDAIFEPVGQKIEKTQQQGNLLFFRDLPSIMRFVEGEEGIYPVQATTPSGQFLIEVSNLPEGADFDHDTGELRWTPGFSDATNLRDYGSNYREYIVNFQLHDKEHPRLFREEEVSLIVFDKPREVVIETEEHSELFEEKEHSQYISFSFPDGADSFIVRLVADDLPVGAKFYTVTKGRKYRLTFKPKAHFVNAYNNQDSEGRHYKDVNFDIQAIGVKGDVTTKVITWRVYDKKKPIEVFAPRKIKVNGDVFFTVVLVDRNGELAPSLAAQSPPTHNRFSFRINKTIFAKYGDEGDKWSYYSIDWKRIPPDKLGTIYELKLKTCAHHNRDCRFFSVDIDFRGAKKETTVSPWNSNNVESGKGEGLEQQKLTPHFPVDPRLGSEYEAL